MIDPRDAVDLDFPPRPKHGLHEWSISRSELNALGADGAVQKPFDIPALIAQIRSHMDRTNYNPGA